MRALVWFRADLRVRDNVAFFRACERADRGVLGVFVVCPGQWREHDWADIRVDFVLRNLEKLGVELARLNVPLLVLEEDRFAGVPSALLRLAERHGCDALYFNREHEWNERRRDERVAEAFRASGRTAHAFTDRTVYPPASVAKKDGSAYTVYGPFRAAWRRRWTEGDRPEALGVPAPQPPTGVAPDPIPRAVRGFRREERWASLWEAGEEAARSRLAAFVAGRIHAYHERRDFPALDGTSGLSPYLTCGAISARACLHAALGANDGRIDSGSPGAVAWIDQLIWSEFYRGILVAFPRVCMHRAFDPRTERVPWRDGGAAFDAWCAGRTGYPIVDAAMRQLLDTGWMHNRLRMVAASFLAKNLLIDWRRGERFFMRRLIDGDLANNNGGWQWSASTGTDPQPYFRVFNPVSQGERHDPDGAFVRRHLPEFEGVGPPGVHDPERLPPVVFARGYPPAIVDARESRRAAVEAFRKAVRGGG